MSKTNLTSNLTEVLSKTDQESLERLACGVATAFSCAGIPIAKRLSGILDLACDTLEMEVGLIAMWSDSVMTPQFLSSSHSKQDRQPLSDGLIERLSNAPHLALQDHDRKGSQRYVAVAVRFDGRLHGVLELRSSKNDKALTKLEQALVQMIAAYAAGPLVLLGATS